jgi:Bacteriophage head to tail connecting protein
MADYPSQSSLVPFPNAPRPPAMGLAMDPNHPLKRHMEQLVAAANLDRDRHLPDIHDVYRYSMPWRHLARQQQPPQRAMYGIYDETAMYTLADFAADMLNVFTPRKNNWVELTPSDELDEVQKASIKQQIGGLQEFLFDKMNRSNLYQALQEAYCDLGVGTMALCVLDHDPSKPLMCEAIPSSDLLLHRGPFGTVDAIFRPRHYQRAEIRVLWPQADLTCLGPEPEIPANTLPGFGIEVTDGCWIDWDRRDTLVYHYGVLCNSHLIWHREYHGPGSCPFIVARWARDSTTAWGFGPTYQVLPAIRTLNYVRHLDIKNYEKYVDPPTSYEDDGITVIDQGIEPGDWIPRAVGSEEPKVLESMARFDVAAMERNELRSTIKRSHYQDRPEQLGKTPPTATQWADEAAERARRMGTPATNLVEELQYPLIRRFMYCYSQRGTIPKVMLDDRVLNMSPQSALLRAQQQEEVVRMDKFAELIAGRFGPQMAIVVIDVVKYATKMGKLMGIDPDVMRDADKIAAAIEQLMPVLQSGIGHAVGGAIAAPPVGAVGP